MHYAIVDPEESDEECELVQVLVYTGCILLGKCTPLIAPGTTRIHHQLRFRLRMEIPTTWIFILEVDALTACFPLSSQLWSEFEFSYFSRNV